jgi:hypothetical protein
MVFTNQIQQYTLRQQLQEASTFRLALGYVKELLRLRWSLRQLNLKD